MAAAATSKSVCNAAVNFDAPVQPPVTSTVVTMNEDGDGGGIEVAGGESPSQLSSGAEDEFLASGPGETRDGARQEDLRPSAEDLGCSSDQERIVQESPEAAQPPTTAMQAPHQPTAAMRAPRH